MAPPPMNRRDFELVTSDNKDEDELATLLEEDRAAQLAKAELLVKSIEHIKDIVEMQQSYARVAAEI